MRWDKNSVIVYFIRMFWMSFSSYFTVLYFFKNNADYLQTTIFALLFSILLTFVEKWGTGNKTN